MKILMFRRSWKVEWWLGMPLKKIQDFSQRIFFILKMVMLYFLSVLDHGIEATEQLFE